MAGIATTGLALTGCTGTAASDDDTITIFAEQQPGKDFNKSAYTLLLEEKFDVDLKFDTTTWDGAAAAEARQISLASGDFPDAYMLIPWVNQFNQSELLKLGDQGVIVPLNDLIEESAPTIKDALEATPEFEALTTSPDGTIWGLPQWNDCFHCSYSSKLWMNTTWLDTLGLSQPTTPEDLYNVLLAFKTQDPNGNGIADEIPLTAYAGSSPLPYLMNPFIYLGEATQNGATPASLGLDDGEVQLQAAQDGWRDGLTFINRLWAAGLIDESAFSQNGDAMKTKGDNADAVIVGAASIHHPAILVSLGQEDGRDKQYDAVAPLTGPNGNPASYRLPSQAGATFVITSKASEAKQQKLVEILDYIFTTEGHLLGEFGEEGVGWEAPGEGDVPLDPELAPLFETLTVDPDSVDDQNAAWGPTAQYNSTAEFRNSQVQPTDIYDPSGYERRLFDATQLYAGLEPEDELFPYWNVWITAEDASEVSTMQTNVENYVAQAAAEFITGSRDISSDAAWTEYLAGIDGLGVDRYLEIYQKAYDG